MTYYTGTKIASALHALKYGNPGLGMLPDPLDHAYAGLVVNDGEGTTLRNSRQPVRENQTRRVASKANQFGFNDWFNKIHIQYRHLDLGNIISSQSVVFTVFNSYFENRLLNNIAEVGGDGLILTQPADTPLVYPPFVSFQYTLSVSTDGPPNVSAAYTFDFDNRDYVLTVVGSRLVLFQFEPDGAIVETLEWMTDVLEAYDGTEQRIQLRNAPRQRIEFEVLLDEGIDDTKLRAALFDWLPRVWGVPIWWEMRRPITPPTPGASTISVSTANGDFRDGGLVMIYQDKDAFEVIGVDAVAPTQLTLTSNVINVYNRKAVVIPVRTAYMAPQVNRRQYPTNAGRTQVAFTTIENKDLSDTTGSITYDGKVILVDPNFMDDTTSEQWDQKVTLIDAGTGRPYQVSGADRSRMHHRKRWKVATAQDLWRIRKLLHSFHGNRTSFWLPSFRNDLQLDDIIGGESSSLRVKHTSFSQMYRSRRPFADLRLLLKNGTYFVRRILSSNVDGSSEVINVNAPFRSTAISIDEVEQIEFVSLVRIANDRAKLTHRRAGTATIDVNLTTVKE